eukprot:145573-Chlamydomonas_euryale.AAC.1
MQNVNKDGVQINTWVLYIYGTGLFIPNLAPVRAPARCSTHPWALVADVLVACLREWRAGLVVPKCDAHRARHLRLTRLRQAGKVGHQALEHRRVAAQLQGGGGGERGLGEWARRVWRASGAGKVGPPRHSSTIVLRPVCVHSRPASMPTPRRHHALVACSPGSARRGKRW